MPRIRASARGARAHRALPGWSRGLKLLLDSCVWGGARPALAREGHDVRWAGDLTRDPGDLELLRQAHTERRVLVTLDKDFGELAIVQGEPHSGIVRLVGFSARQQGPICSRVLALQFG